MAIRRISDNMMLNANNSLEFWLFFQRRSDWKTTRIKAIYGTGKYRVDHIINQSNEVIKDFEVNVQSKKEIRFDINILLKLRLTTTVALDITERKKATEDLKKANKARLQCNVKKIRTIFSQI
jgi:hypothetical protein